MRQSCTQQEVEEKAHQHCSFTTLLVSYIKQKPSSSNVKSGTHQSQSTAKEEEKDNYKQFVPALLLNETQHIAIPTHLASRFEKVR